MSATHRSLSRIPLCVFTDLSASHDSDLSDHPADLRDAICAKLSGYQSKSTVGVAGSDGVISIGQLLKLSPLALARLLDPILTDGECNELLRRILSVCAPAPVSALSLLRQTTDKFSDQSERGFDEAGEKIRRSRILPTGMDRLDGCLRGGFRVGITELVGRAGVGKSQMAMQLCVMAAKNDLGSVYIDTEKKMSIRRLKEIAFTRAKTFNANSSIVENGEQFQYQNDLDSGPAPRDIEGPNEEREVLYGEYKEPSVVLDNVTIHSPGSTKEMLAVVCNRLEEEILKRNDDAWLHRNESNERTKFPVGLVVLDSIAAPARRDFGIETAPQRVAALFQTAQMLKRIADQLQVAVVVINQIGTIGDSESSLDVTAQPSANHGEDGSDFVSVHAALGSSWHHCVSTRLLLEHERDPHREATKKDLVHDTANLQDDHSERVAWMSERGHVRKATVVKSNVAGCSSMAYEVAAVGVSQLV